MKITNRKGIVKSYSHGSIEKQREELVQIAQYIQTQLNAAHAIIDETNAVPSVKEPKKTRAKNDAIRREAQEIGILQNGGKK